VAALLALAFDFSVANQTIEPRAGLPIIGGADQPRAAVQDSHALDGILSKILASILRAIIRCGSLQARSVNLRNIGMREPGAFLTIVLITSPCSTLFSEPQRRQRTRDASKRRWQRCHPETRVFTPAALGLKVEVDAGNRDPNDWQLARAVRRRPGSHFFLALVSTGGAIFSFSSVQVLRTSAVTSEQFSI
jgi:hypothetical protein